MYPKMMLMGVCLVLASIPVRAPRGILKNKPTNSTPCARGYYTRFANDGRFDKGAILVTYDAPYIQVDLQDIYIVMTMIVSNYKRSWRSYLKGAYIGVSKNGDDFIKCGQWPLVDLLKEDSPQWNTLELLCSCAGPVRFVKVWKMTKCRMTVLEMDAEVVRFPGFTPLSETMHQATTRRVQNSTSVSASSLIHCAQICRLQFCNSFSYSPLKKANCLIANHGLTVVDSIWDSWSCTS